MSAPDIGRIVQQSGALYFGVTDLSAANYGGTCLGLVKDLEFRLRSDSDQPLPITAEEWGGKITDAIEPTALAEIMCAGVLRGMDPDAIGLLFPNTSLGSSGSGERVINLQANGAIRGGGHVNERVTKLLFAPDDTMYGTFILIYKAMPLVQAAAVLQTRLGTGLGAAVAFWGVPDTGTGTTKAVGQIGPKSKLSLTPA